MILDKPPLFENRREFVSVTLFLLSIFLLRLFLLYHEYLEFISKPFYYTNARVLIQYTKHGQYGSYAVLKLESVEGKAFYVTSHRLEDLSGKSLRVKIYPDSSIGFVDYLGTFYVKAKLRVIGEAEISREKRVAAWIASQHRDTEIAAFYQAIFIAAPVPKILREKISGLGVNHLVALSGFHLTILWGLIYGVLSLIYRLVQQRYFPYRFMLLDLGVVTVGILGYYLWFVGFPPSLLRSYTMLFIAWVMLLLGIELLSFQFLAFVSLLLLVIFPSLSVSLGFWFSVLGVFYIYLVLYWSQKSNTWLKHKWSVTFFSIPVGIFVLMLPVAHTVFGVTCPWQLLSPLLSLIFIPFYPLSIVFHLLHEGGLLDHALIYLFSLSHDCYESTLPLWTSAGYLLISLGAIKSRILFAATVGMALLYLLYLFVFI